MCYIVCSIYVCYRSYGKDNTVTIDTVIYKPENTASLTMKSVIGTPAKKKGFTLITGRLYQCEYENTGYTKGQYFEYKLIKGTLLNKNV